MARNTGRFNRLLELIGLVDDEPEEEKAPAESAPGRRVASRETRARYGATSPETAYGAARGRSGYSGSSYGSTGRVAPYSRDDYRPAPRPASSYRSQSDAFERYPSEARSRISREPADELEFEPMPASVRRGAPERARPAASSARQTLPSGPRPDSSKGTIIYNLHMLEDCRNVISDLLKGKSVVLNLEDMDDREIQRAIDTLGGAAFALGATLRRVADRAYLIAPTSVDIASNEYDYGRR